MHSGIKRLPHSLLSRQMVKPQPNRRNTSTKGNMTTGLLFFFFYCHSLVWREAIGGAASMTRCPAATDSPLLPILLYLGAVRNLMKTSVSAFSAKWLKTKEGQVCGLLYRNMNEGKAIYKAEKATPGGLAGWTLYLSQRHVSLIRWFRCQQAPVFLAHTCKWPWKFWQTAKQAVTSGAPPAFLWRLLRTVHGVAISGICIPQPPAFTVHLKYTFLLNPLFCDVLGEWFNCRLACFSSSHACRQVCHLIRYAARLHFCRTSIWGLIAFWLKSFLSLSLLSRNRLAMIAPSSVTSQFKFTFGDIPIIRQVMWGKSSLFSPGRLIALFPSSYLLHNIVFFVFFSVHPTEFILSSTVVFK